jgi:hypothetical protein
LIKAEEFIGANKISSSNNAFMNAHSREDAQVRVISLVIVVFLLGIATGILVYRSMLHPTGRNGAESSVAAGNLSDSTKAVLQRLDSRVEIRYYSLLDPENASNSLPVFASRIDQLLKNFAREAGGKIQVTRYASPSDAATDAAAADGIQPFNLEKGDARFLGIAVAQNDRKESLPQLSPEWEQAVEFDLSRAIARVTAPRPATSPFAATAQRASSAKEEVKRIVPNVDSLPLEEGRRVLQEKALNDFRAVANQMEIQVKEAQQKLAQAQGSKSEAEQQAALKRLQDLQAEQAEKLKTIAIELQDQIAALERLKRGN